MTGYEPKPRVNSLTPIDLPEASKVLHCRIRSEPSILSKFREREIAAEQEPCQRAKTPQTDNQKEPNIAPGRVSTADTDVISQDRAPT